MRVELFVVLAFVAVAAARTAFQGSYLSKKSNVLDRLFERKLSKEEKEQKAKEIAAKIQDQMKNAGEGADKRDMDMRSVLLKKTNRFAAHKRSGEVGECTGYESPCDTSDPAYWECAVTAALFMEFTFDDIYSTSEGESLFSECMHGHLWYFRAGDHCLTLEEVLNFEAMYDYLAIEKFSEIWDTLDAETQELVLDLACTYDALKEQAYEFSPTEKK